MKTARPSQIRISISLLALLMALALCPFAAEAQISPMSLKFQSDNYQVLNRADTSEGFEIQYLPKGEDKNAWTQMLVVSKHPDKNIKDAAFKVAGEIERRRGVDRYSGVLAMETRSKESVFLDMVKSEDTYVECAFVRYFKGKEGAVYSYKMIRRMSRARLPADMTLSNLEIMKFIDRARMKRSDLIIDFARKTMPFQVADDPMGLSRLPLPDTKRTGSAAKSGN